MAFGLLGGGSMQGGYALPQNGLMQLNSNPGLLQGISQGLMGLGTGLLSGQNWGQGIGLGLQGANQGIQQAQQYATVAEERKARAKLLELETKKYQTEADQAAAYASAAAGLPVPQGVDEATWARLPADEKVKLSAGIIANQSKPFSPNLQKVDKGNQEETGYFDQSGKWVTMGSGSRFAPQQPQQPTEFSTWLNQFKTDNKRNPTAAEIGAFNKSGTSGSMIDAVATTAAGDVSFKYNPQTRETNLLSPDKSHFLTLDEMGGKAPASQPSAPMVPWSQNVPQQAGQSPSAPPQPQVQGQQPGVDLSPYAKQRSAMRVYDAQGNLLVDIGGNEGGGAGMSQGTKAAYQTDLLNANKALQRLSMIEQTYKPEYQTMPTKLGMAWDDFKTKINPNALDPQSQQQLNDFSQFRTYAFANVNQSIKDLTGVAMNQTEGQRLLQQLPDPGTGITDGDGPVVFKSKLDAVTKSAKNSVMRANYASNHGLNPLSSGIDLASIPDLVNKRGDEIANQLKATNPSISDEMLHQQVTMQLTQEFGATP